MSVTEIPPPDRRLVFAPLVTLGVTASLLAGHGIAAGWLHIPVRSASYIGALLVAAAWHAGWLLPASRRSGAFTVGAAWLASVWLCRRGMQAVGFADAAALWAALLEGALLVLALQLRPPASWADRLARWRRARAEVSAQLALWPGVVPWVRASCRGLLYGTPERTSSPMLDRFIRDLRDAEARLGGRIAGAAMPEAAREALLASAHTIAAQGELASVEIGLALEHRALCEVVAFRDRCERLPGLTAEERRHIASQGEALLLELAGSRSVAMSALGCERGSLMETHT